MESVCALHSFEFQASANIVIALSGNKADLTTNRIGEEKYQYSTNAGCNTDRDPISVEYDEASAYAEENGLLFMETSAKTALNVNDIFLVWNHHSYSDDTRTSSNHCDSFQAIAKKLPKDGEGGAGAGSGGPRLTQGGGAEGKTSCCNK